MDISFFPLWTPAKIQWNLGSQIYFGPENCLRNNLFDNTISFVCCLRVMWLIIQVSAWKGCQLENQDPKFVIQLRHFFHEQLGPEPNCSRTKTSENWGLNILAFLVFKPTGFRFGTYIISSPASQAFTFGLYTTIRSTGSPGCLQLTSDLGTCHLSASIITGTNFLS